MEINNFMECYKMVKDACPKSDEGLGQGIAYRKCLEIFPSTEVMQHGNVMPDAVPEHNLYNIDQEESPNSEASTKIEALINQYNKG